MKILANDGISQSGIDALEEKGYEVLTVKVAQEQLINYINDNNIDAILVRGITQIQEELIEACPSIKLIGCAGVDMDSIDVDFAKENGVHVINTPEATSQAIAELVFAHLFGMVRFLHQANREMPLEGETRFNVLKREFAAGIELKGKTLGIIGNDPSGKDVAKIGLAVGMKVIFSGSYSDENTITVPFYNGQSIDIEVETEPLKEVLKNADFITLHATSNEGYIIGNEQLKNMNDGVAIVNASQGGILDEVALVNYIESGKVKYAALDVFENEPNPEIQLLMNTSLSLSPHIGSSTLEAQDRIGTELAKQIIELLSE